jgi:transcription antitermination factor NusG
MSDVKEWFPMRVTYSREKQVKEALDTLGIECFLPMKNKLVTIGTQRHYMLVPAVHNLIFVRSTQNELTEMKNKQRELLSLRYMTRPINYGTRAEKHVIMRVPDDQMENFMRVATITDDRVMFLDYVDSKSILGRKVRIIDGDFAGVEGVVVRIQKNKRVVVHLEGLAAVAIAFVPPSFLAYK